jgi:hypothetical protein
VAAIEAEFGIAPAAQHHRRHQDGRFIARICPQVMEFGVRNASIHKVDEWVRGGRHRAAEEHLPAHAGKLPAMTVIELIERCKAPASRGGRFVWARHHQRLRRSRLAGAVALGLPLDALDDHGTRKVTQAMWPPCTR